MKSFIARLTATDSGVGIPKNTQEKMFTLMFTIKFTDLLSCLITIDGVHG